MKLVVGLGNPGRRYAKTRHNVGFRAAERFARSHGIALEEEAFEGRLGRGVATRGADEPLDVAVLLPETWMNLSGESVAPAVRTLVPESPQTDLVVVFDDVDLPFGRLRLRASGGTGGHRGMESIVGELEHGEFARLRFGVGRPPGDLETTDWVLSRFAADEERALEGHLARAAEALDAWLFDGVAAAMNRFNRASETPEEAG